jgi:PRC-barrel domain
MNGFTNFATYLAPAATMIAACMTAANLGPRITGWGFVVFALGSIAWSAVALSTGQQSLLLTNNFLLIVNMIGAWRWLGRIARFNDGAKAAEEKSRDTPSPTLVNIGAIEGRPILNPAGVKLGHAVGMMATVDEGRISYLVAGLGGVGGVGERLVALPWLHMKIDPDGLVVRMSDAELDKLPLLDAADWPIHQDVTETER